MGMDEGNVSERRAERNKRRDVRGTILVYFFFCNHRLCYMFRGLGVFLLFVLLGAFLALAL
jgi:hypothetical protein